MAKIKSNNFLNTVTEVFTDAISAGVLHLYAEGSDFTGRHIEVNGQRLFHFGTTGYLGLEQDVRLKAAAIQAIERYGTQFPLSKSYISHPLYKDLEDRIKEMYQHPIVITKNSTLGHMGVIPSAINDEDAIILDHQVHWSVQSAAKILKTRSVPIDMVRHNDLNMLEDKIKSYSKNRQKIWYMADGIYSMYGDFAPIKELEQLAIKYPQLHLYFDDVHGMSWIGKNGTGYVMSELDELTDNMLLFGTLSKTFGASGSVLVCPDKKLHHHIKTFGGPLTFSAQLEPASVGAAIASADIHLSPEIYTLQGDLKERVDYFNGLIGQTDLPVIDNNRSPVFFIGTGMPSTGYNFINRLMKEGFYVNLGMFPAVPVKNTGVRITISRHNQKEEIKGLVDAMTYHLPQALEETFTDLPRVYHAFKLGSIPKKEANVPKGLVLTLETKIERIDKTTWNAHVGQHGVYDWDGLKFLARTFNDYSLLEHNWRFYYIMIHDDKGQLVLATFMTMSIWKDDMLANVVASERIEQERLKDPYHLTSRVLSMGCLFTEGTHLWSDHYHSKHTDALNLLMHTMEQIEKRQKADMVVLRDFKATEPLHEYFQGQGFVRVPMPSTSKVHFKEDDTLESYFSRLSKRNRKHLKKEILLQAHRMHIDIRQKLTFSEIDQVRTLYLNVHQNNLGLNTFPFPEKLFHLISGHSLWEIITISRSDRPEKFIGVMLCYKNKQSVYVPSFVGLDYDVLHDYHTYRQLLYQTIKRALNLNFKTIDFGMTASFEKRKLGAVVEDAYAYIQSADNYTLELMGLLEAK